MVLSRPLKGWLSKAEHGTLGVRPNEYYIDPIVGCRAGCTYCYLQGSTIAQSPMCFHVDLRDLSREIERLVARLDSRDSVLLCTGESADSLAEVSLFPVGRILVHLVASLGESVRLELRTKSDAVRMLPQTGHGGRTTVSFSISPSPHVARYEPGTISLSERLLAARWCQDHQYPLGLNCEPLLLTENWQEYWTQTLVEIVDTIRPGQIDHISIGCLRWNTALGALPRFRAHHGGLMEHPANIEYRPGQWNQTAPLHARLAAYRWLRMALRDCGIRAPLRWSMEETAVIEQMDTNG